MWIDFFICLFLGMFGVHKFREKKIGIGILYLCTMGLFGIGWFIDCIRYLMVALRGEKLDNSNTPPELSENSRSILLPDGTLPIVIDCSLALQDGECCHYSAPAKRIIPREKTVGYTSGSAGVSFRVAKGVTLRTGSSRGSAIKKNVLEESPGTLRITNHRIIFTSVKGGFDKKISNLSTVTEADDGLVLQFGSQMFMLELKDGGKAYQILSFLANA